MEIIGNYHVDYYNYASVDMKDNGLRFYTLPKYHVPTEH